MKPPASRHSLNACDAGSCPLLSVVVCLAREWFQNFGDDDNDAIDMLTDITSWTLGAIVASLVF